MTGVMSENGKGSSIRPAWQLCHSQILLNLTGGAAVSRWILLGAILLITFSGLLLAENHGTEQTISRVENGLVAMNLPSVLEQFQTDHLNAEPKLALSDRMKQYGVPGIGIAVINNYKVEWARGYGVLEAGGGQPVSEATCFEAASSTKLLTTVIALRLVEQRLIDLDEDVNRYLKSWKIPDSEWTSGEKVTLRRLLCHQSGLNRPDGGFNEEEGSAPTLLQVLKGEAPALNDAAVVEFLPGSKYQYSNIGYLVIQLLLEDVTAKPYRQLASETVFKPLGMKSSTLTHPLTKEFNQKTALPHDNEGQAHRRSQSAGALAHGGLVTTPSDWALFAIELMRAWQGESNRLLSQKTARLMFSQVQELDPAEYFGMSAGLGVFLVGEGEGLYFTHPGQNMPGTTCVLIGSPATGKGAVIMANGVAGLMLTMEIFPALVNTYGWPTMVE
jgi:CubicO group peptidase (beta-lactamase class C family)